MTSASSDLHEALDRWRETNAELASLQLQLCAAMLAASENNAEAPRDLILATERKRTEADALFQFALDLLDASSPVRTGMTGFGTL